jgi:BrnA antitoxin of type II toxin-antitoxin system
MAHHDAGMRTTLTLDADVAERLRQEVRRTGKGLKTVVNEALRRGLGGGGKPARRPRFEVRPHAFGVRPGVDLDRVNQLVDELEAAETARRLRT